MGAREDGLDGLGSRRLDVSLGLRLLGVWWKGLFGFVARQPGTALSSAWSLETERSALASRVNIFGGVNWGRVASTRDRNEIQDNSQIGGFPGPRVRGCACPVSNSGIKAMSSLGLVLVVTLAPASPDPRRGRGELVDAACNDTPCVLSAPSLSWRGTFVAVSLTPFGELQLANASGSNARAGWFSQ